MTSQRLLRPGRGHRGDGRLRADHQGRDSPQNRIGP